MRSFTCLAATVLLSLLPGSLASGGDNKWLSPVYHNFFQFPLPTPPEAVKKSSLDNIDYYEIDITPFSYNPYPDLGPAHLVGYNGISPGPTFRMTQGREAVVRFINRYDRPSAIHLHGSFSRTPFDGWAEDVIPPLNGLGDTPTGKQSASVWYKDYYYPNAQNARTLWYHDHAVGITAVNAYFGQAGFYILSDAHEDSLDLPSGENELLLMIQSKQYQSNGDLFSPVNERVSLFGDVIHVNGQPWPYKTVDPRKYRMRLLDASVSRSFHLSFLVDGKTTPIPFTVIASDCGLLAKPVVTSDLWISMAERWEIIVDFAGFEGKNITLKNARNVGVDDDYFGTDRVMQFRVSNKVIPANAPGNGPLPATLRDLDVPGPKTTVDRSFRFERKNGEWEINGVTFDEVENRVLARPERGTTEVWELQNGGGGWSHPIHIHLIDFKVISRTNGRNAVTPYEQQALKDVVWLAPGETVHVIAKYAPWDGVYMFHCHNLVHEDHDMMGAFNVTALEDFGYSETTHFIDPMDIKYRAKPYPPTLSIQDQLQAYKALNAYPPAASVEAALDAYHATHTSATPSPTSNSGKGGH